jgi:hypothetical protein
MPSFYLPPPRIFAKEINIHTKLKAEGNMPSNSKK